VRCPVTIRGSEGLVVAIATFSMTVNLAATEKSTRKSRT
jgi:GTP cyclohydrolase FolE2